MFVPCRTLLDSWTVPCIYSLELAKKGGISAIKYDIYPFTSWSSKSLETYIIINFRVRGISIQEKIWCIKPFIYPSNDTPIHLLISRMIFWVKLKQAWLASYTFDSLLFVSFYLYVVFCIY
jgi:hypothetical protein